MVPHLQLTHKTICLPKTVDISLVHSRVKFNLIRVNLIVPSSNTLPLDINIVNLT